MRVYRYKYKRKKNKYKTVVAAAVGLAAVLLFFKDHGSTVQLLKKELQTACYKGILDIYMPGIVSGTEGEEFETAADYLIRHFFPVGDYAVTVESYPTQVESELSYEMILAREAADENYVDAVTGELVESAGTAPDIAAADAQSGSDDVDASGTGSDTEGTENNTDTTAEGFGEAENTANAGETENTADEGGMPVFASASEKVVNYSRDKLSDFDYLVQNFYQVDNTTTINSSQLNIDALLGKDVRLSHDASTPQVLIYHTHSQEGYADSVPGDPSMTVVGVADYLTKILTEQYGMNVIHHTGEYDVGDRDHAYSRAGPALEQLLAENPSVEVVIDLHRDGVREGTRLVTNMNGVEMAQIMFFNGLSRTTSTGDIDYLYNPYIADNLSVSFQMQLAAAEYYPGFTRRIYLKGYRYNMHYCPKTLLIEVGAQTNTLQEAKNSMVPLADLLNKVLTGR